ncbi:MAG: SIS domain-containing protein [Candidatus Omnitrophota bacterium]|nr:SIS domain-containing protein [Candidatus Omnitrophota bacterium]
MDFQYLPITNYLRRLGEIALWTEVNAGAGENTNAISLDDGSKRAVQMILDAKFGQSKIMLVGNGGSAAIVSHMQNDLCDSVKARAMVFNEPPFLTAVSNDHGYATFFEDAVKLWAEPGDVLIAISSSGKSENILRAVRAARAKDSEVITLSGFDEKNPLRSLGDLNFYVPANEYGIVETAHGILCHYMSDAALAALNVPRPVA